MIIDNLYTLRRGVILIPRVLRMQRLIAILGVPLLVLNIL